MWSEPQSAETPCGRLRAKIAGLSSTQETYSTKRLISFPSTHMPLYHSSFSWATVEKPSKSKKVIFRIAIVACDRAVFPFFNSLNGEVVLIRAKSKSKSIFNGSRACALSSDFVFGVRVGYPLISCYSCCYDVVFPKIHIYTIMAI